MLVEDDPTRAAARATRWTAGERDRVRVRAEGTRRPARSRPARPSSGSRASPARRAGRHASRAYDGLVAPHARRVLCRRSSIPLQARGTVSASRLATLRALRLPVPAAARAAPGAGARARGAPQARAAGARHPVPRRGRALPARAARPRRAARARHRAARARVSRDGRRGARRASSRAARRASRCSGSASSARFRETLLRLAAREAGGGRALDAARTSRSASGCGAEPRAGEPHDPEPLAIDLGDGRGSARLGPHRPHRPRARTAPSSCATTRRAGRRTDDGGLFRGGKQLQIPFYVLAAAKLFPGEPRRRGLPRLRRRRPAGGVRSRARDGPKLHGAAARARGR